MYLYFMLMVVIVYVEAACRVNMKDVEKSQVLLLKPGDGITAEDAILYPTNKQFTFITNQTVHIDCVDSSIFVKGKSIDNTSAILTCNVNTEFLLDNRKVKFTEIKCGKKIKSVARLTNSSCLEEEETAGEIGIKLSDGRFIVHIQFCFNTTEYTTYYSRHVIVPEIDSCLVNPRPIFANGGLYDIPIKDVYTKASETKIVNQLLGLPKDSDMYIKTGKGVGDYYLATGHLTPKCDFVYAFQQDLTHYYVNAVPQWQTNNAGNWLALERSVRAFVIDNEYQLEVYTGYGEACRLPHKGTYSSTDIFLYRKKDESLVVPVPGVMWKIVRDPKRNKGIVFVVVNNPYDKNRKPLCTDICHQIMWIKWDPNDRKKGFAYCCEYKDFKEVINTAPNVTIDSVLNK